MAEAKASKKQFYLGTGRRKTSVARVRMSEGSGKILINGRELNDFFTEDKDRSAVLGPLDVTEMRNRVDVTASVNGGGFSGQGGAVCQGIARALKNMFGGARRTVSFPRWPCPRTDSSSFARSARGASALDRVAAASASVLVRRLAR